MKEKAKETLALHEKNKGKLEVKSKVPLKNRKDLSLAYTPGVAYVCREIVKNKDNAYKYTTKANSVAIITDGSAVLGLGNIGGVAGLPVMEGKAILFKEFADIDAFPLCFERYTPYFIEAIKCLAPSFGGINLEDIAAPRCFEIEDELKDIGIPVMHDDQHGTAVVLLAALINACKVTGKKLTELSVVVNGAGAAGFAITRFLHCLGIDNKMCKKVKKLIVCDTKGIIHRSRLELLDNKYKYIIAQETNHENRVGTLKEAIVGADVFIGVSTCRILTQEMIKTMNPDPIIFAMANPVPEIYPEEAFKAGASIVGTGRSDFDNQINNVLAFPGIFRGALDVRARKITDHMLLAAAYAIAKSVKKPKKNMIVPSVLDKSVAKAVAKAVSKAAKKDKVARIF
ncbi:NADP-dependent malic enzyme [Candidatus Woesearchaeota archaeon]|nr:NADP-dependent malic enzyme [Candidatus Woesearchaeota archaeon]